MSMKLGAWILAGSLSLISSAALADVAGAPPGGGGSGGGTTTSTGGSGGKSSGGCSAVSPGGATTSAAILVGVGLLLVAPALRRKRARKGDRG